VRTPDPYDRNHADLEAFRAEVRDALGLMKSQHEALLNAIGKASDDGKGGSGLTGQLLRLQADVRGLLDLKTKGMGVFLAVMFFGALIVAGFKDWVTGLFTTPPS
jgi:hypothetical protein